jgi:hypothetical protein
MYTDNRIRHTGHKIHMPLMNLMEKQKGIVWVIWKTKSTKNELGDMKKIK